MDVPEEGLVQVHLKTDLENIHDLSRSLFFAFAEHKHALLEMTLKKANLEDIFLELTEQSQQLPSEEESEVESA